MRIAFDGTTLTPGRTGVGYYTEHLLQHLAREVENTGDEIVVVSNKPIDTERPLPPHVRVHEGHRFPVRIGWMQMRAARALAALRPDVAHFTNGMIPIGSPVSTIVTIHDMSLRLYPHCHPVRRLLLNRPLMHVAIRQAASIVTVSHSARRDLLRFHGVPPDRVAVVHEAASPAFRPIDDRAMLDRVRAQYGLPPRFALYVGTIEPRKNLSRLVEAFAIARLRGMAQHLVCVGPYGWSSRDLAGRIERLGIKDAVHFTGTDGSAPGLGDGAVAGETATPAAWWYTASISFAVRAHEKRLECSKPLCARSRRRSGLVARRNIASARASVLVGSIVSAASPAISPSDDVLDVSTARPDAIASTTGRPNPSYRDGNTKKSPRL